MPKVTPIYIGLKVGSQMMAYKDWQHCNDPEGLCQLIEFDRHYGTFQIRGGVYMGERWRVKFVGTGFISHRYFRTKN